ncbi:MAG TPA: lysophospholipid acyltransferase family protein [Jatrophihabitans sp.]|jgi:1-acyl-sn-glycerol-3-phosphate acyltransferase|nr:lysophospholipid acyltransferase family protein [Jatrophihabitans sp.]
MSRRLSYEQAHARARDKGVNKLLLRFVRLVLVPFFRLAFGMRVSGKEHVPRTGPVIIAPNHKSFWDAFFIATVLRRPVRFMGKAELFEGRRGRLFIALGAFPVRRGASDAEAIETARTILEQGNVLALFPEGTRVRDPNVLGTPRRGAARLALETGAPLIPTAMTGTERRRFHLPRSVQISFGEPIEVAGREATPDAATELLEDTLWPTVSADYRRLKAGPGLLAAGAAAAGLGLLIRQRRKRR